MTKIFIDGAYWSHERIVETNSGEVSQPNTMEALKFLQAWWKGAESFSAKTSGSTGAPKLIELSRAAMQCSAKATGKYFGNPSTLFCPLPMKFIAGKMMLVRALEWNSELHIFTPCSNPLDLVVKTFDFGVMTPHQLIEGLQSQSHNHVTNIKHLLLGGSPLPHVWEDKIQELETKIYLGYGMTETMSHVALRTVNGQDKHKKYIATEGNSFSLDDRNCLVIHNDTLLKTSLQTNDVVRLINQYSFEWLSRYDDVINSGGLKIYPTELENALMNSIHVPFYVSKKKDEKYGEIAVLIVESNGMDNLKNELSTLMHKLLPKTHIPKEIIFEKSFAYTENGKLKRREI